MRHRLASTALGITILLLGTHAALAKQFGRTSYVKAGTPRPHAVVVADFDNDGNLDIACTDFYRGEVSILLGNGNGTFQAPIKFSAPSAIALAVGDFNNDGLPDLVVVEFGGTGTGALGMFLGTGNGHFRNSANYNVGIQPYSVAVGDFDGDGKLDVAVADSNQNNKRGDVRVFMGTGKGTLKPPTIYPVKGAPFGIAARDLNGDSFPDLAVTQETAGSVAVLLNDGTGKFLAPVSYSAGGGEVVDVKVADLRSNGDQDLVVANLSRGMVVLLNNGNGTFGKPTIYVATCHNCQGPEACVAADFNLDGNLNVACATNIDDSYFFYGDGAGKFGSAIPINDTINLNGGYSIAAGDFNNDKAPDLAIPIELKGKVAIMLNTQ
jgi:hypothetical protein